MRIRRLGTDHKLCQLRGDQDQQGYAGNQKNADPSRSKYSSIPETES